ncbi:MAG: hypothetical protein CMF61_00170 [Magnetococcales bacterium]|nr:hypothetical protein [Magnetococcales bacterium]PPR17108.1 MAG: hypothetical protein CFH43_00776 [Pseudomonadota bacterium]
MQLTVKPNPLKGKNALLCFKSKGVFKFNNAEVHFSYVPDREIVEKESFTIHIKKIEKEFSESSSIESFANKVIEDFYKAALPFFAKLDITVRHETTGEIQRIQMIETQPNYKLPPEVEKLI